MSNILTSTNFNAILLCRTSPLHTRSNHPDIKQKLLPTVLKTKGNLVPHFLKKYKNNSGTVSEFVM